MNAGQSLEDAQMLIKIWRKCAPEQRLMQYLYNLCKDAYPDLDGDDFYYMRDSEIRELAEADAIRRLLDQA